MADRIVVIGVGTDRPARPVPSDTSLVVGGRRHLDAHAPGGVATSAIGGDLDAVTDRIAATAGTVVVLASGDPGWFGIVRRLATRFGADPLEVHPAPSAVATAFARFGASWDDAVVVSAHGRDARATVAAVLAHPKVAVMTAPDVLPADLARALLDAGCGPRRVIVASRLGHADEAVRDTDLHGVPDVAVDHPNVLLVLDPSHPEPPAPSVVGHQRSAGPWARPTDAYLHRDGQVTKPVIRAVALAHLGPGPGRLVWDLGCGSGSVAVEAAGLGAGVVAVDRDLDQVERTRANAAAHGVRLGLVHGVAPTALAALPDPDAVFVGGGGTELRAVLDVVATRCRDRAVVALATIERVAPTVAQLRDHGWAVRAQLLEAHDLVPLGDGHRLAPHNPVVLVLAERP